MQMSSLNILDDSLVIDLQIHFDKSILYNKVIKQVYLKDLDSPFLLKLMANT